MTRSVSTLPITLFVEYNFFHDELYARLHIFVRAKDRVRERENKS